MRPYTNRAELIDLILADLTSLAESGGTKDRYALEQNIKFFTAARSLASYIPWLLFDLPHIDGARLLELSDFGNPRWQKLLQEELLRIEKWKFPDLLGPVRNAVVRKIVQLSSGIGRPFVAVSIGSGAMELERQIILQLQRKKYSGRVVFICIDHSQESIEAGLRNTADLHVTQLRLEKLNPEVVEDILSQRHGGQFVLVAHRGDALTLDRYFSDNSVDIAYYSKFIHHLVGANKDRFAAILPRLTKCIIESDDYRGLYLPLLSVFTNWKSPVLLNGAVFSSLRDPDKKTLKQASAPHWTINIVPLSGYVKTYHAP